MKKILIAEDSSFFRRELVRSLEEGGYFTVEAQNGQEALELLAADRSITIAVVDWHMPLLNGPEVCQRAKTLRQDHFIYCILFTSQHEVNDIVAGMDAGADDFITKSRSFEELHARIRAGSRIVSLHEKLKDEKERLQLTNDALLNITRELKEKEVMLAQRTRLEAMGELAAEIAHEINTPAQYIRDNTFFVLEELRNMSALYTAYEDLISHLSDEPKELIGSLKALLDFEHLTQEIPLALEQSLKGVEAITRIVASVKELARPFPGGRRSDGQPWDQ